MSAMNEWKLRETMCEIGRRIYVHINNTNPILDERSPEAETVRGRGWEIAHDGMEVVL